jgi:very-short-patch-repair endonuclease
MRKQPSQAERAVWEIVRDRRVLGAKFRRQHPIDHYIADFACVDAKLILEIDGRSHDSGEQRLRDGIRAKRLNELGWRIVVIRDDEVLSDATLVAELVASALRAAPSP